MAHYFSVHTHAATTRVGLLLACVVLASTEVGAQQNADPLAALVQRGKPDTAGQRLPIVALPADLVAAIQSKAPGFRVRRATELSYQASDAFSLAELRTQSNLAVITDLDGDKINDAVLWGVIESPRAPRPAADGDMEQTAVVLGVRRVGGAYDVTELVRHTETLHVSYEGSPAATELVLSLQRLSATGRAVSPKARGAVPWVRLQDGDCKSAGLQWTLRLGHWISSRSFCTYGE